MVQISEQENMFWGVTLDGGKRYTQTVETSFHISGAALDVGTNPGDKPNRVAVMIQHEKAEFLICTLDNKHHFQQYLDLNFTEGEEVTFFLNGKGVVHLTGYLVPEGGPDEFDSRLEGLTESDSDDDDDEEDSEAQEADSDEDIPMLRALKGVKRKGENGLESLVKKLKKQEQPEEEDDEDSDEDPSFMDSLIAGESEDDDDSEEDDSEDEEDEDDSDDEEDDSEDEADLSGSFLDTSLKKSPKAEMKQEKKTPKSEKKQAQKKTPKSGIKEEVTTPKSAKKEGGKTPKSAKKNEDAKSPANEVKQKTKTPKSGKKEKGQEQNQEVSTPSNGVTQSKKKKDKSKTPQAAEAAVTSSGASPKSEKKKKNKKTKGGESEVQSPGGKNKKMVLTGGTVMEELKEGHGPEAKPSKMVHVYYKGCLSNGKVFDACTTGNPFKFKLGKQEVIRGWDVGVAGMKVGGKRKLTVPASQAYGSQRVGSIPANSTLEFTVELKAVS